MTSMLLESAQPPSSYRAETCIIGATNECRGENVLHEFGLNSSDASGTREDGVRACLLCLLPSVLPQDAVEITQGDTIIEPSARIASVRVVTICTQQNGGSEPMRSSKRRLKPPRHKRVLRIHPSRITIRWVLPSFVRGMQSGLSRIGVSSTVA